MKATKVCKIAAIVFCAVLLLSSCHAIQDEGNGSTHVLPYSQGNTNDTTITVYRYSKNYSMLSPVTYTCTIPIETAKEKYILEYLISGVEGNSEFVNVINPATEVKEIYSRGNTLFITFSADFLNWNTKSNTEKQMCIYSIVNSMTEDGKYNKVQLLVDRNGNGGERIKTAEAGFVEHREEYLEALSRNEEVVISPLFIAQQAFSYMAKREWNEVYNMIKESDNREDYEVFSSLCDSAITSIGSYTFSQGVIAPAGNHAVVLCAFDVKRGDSFSEYRDVPMALSFVDGSWKIDYNFFERFLLGTNA